MVQAVNKFLRVGGILGVNCLNYSGIAGYFQGASERNHAVAAFVGVVYFFAVDHINASVGIDFGGGVYHAVFECGQKGSKLERGSGLGSFPDGIVPKLGVVRVAFFASQVNHCADFARGHLHHNHATVFRLKLLQSLQ